MVGREASWVLFVDGWVVALTWTFAVVAFMVVSLAVCLFHFRDPFPEWVGLVELLDVCHLVDIEYFNMMVAKLIVELKNREQCRKNQMKYAMIYPYVYVLLAPRGNKTAYTLAMTSQTYAMRGA